ncbi:uncharacterized protein LOC132047377 [Lycium ferocissimum]|uniref:uncharacterized protein LOC132047377 n=1 Tax=Lycium ferocissimum TaxID=112874 RepID=UPI002814CCCD|nr:uncharacterized protein LOC132047377 [Lycium ferocissimum]
MQQRHFSNNDALVITVFIDCFQVKRVMVDPRSLANIIHWKLVEQMGLLEKIIPAAKALAGFNMSSETTKREIDLPMKSRGVVTKFYVIDGDMRYNAIFGRLWLHDIKAVPSNCVLFEVLYSKKIERHSEEQLQQRRCLQLRTLK